VAAVAVDVLAVVVVAVVVACAAEVDGARVVVIAVVATERVSGEGPVRVGWMSGEVEPTRLLDRTGLLDDDSADGAGDPSCGTVTTTVAPARAAATGAADGEALTATEDEVLDADVATVQPARPTASEVPTTVRSTACRHGRGAEDADMNRSYTTDPGDPGKPGPPPRCGGSPPSEGPGPRR
jgi:hypothetical protein